MGAALLLTPGIAQAQCTTNADCWAGACVDGFCVDTCEDNSDCNNGLFCDGVETCNATALPSIGLCVPGEIPCGSDFCDEDAAPGYQCVECATNADCFGGVCKTGDTVCVECNWNGQCDNGHYCDGQETCSFNVCIVGDIPCAGQFCNETGSGSGECLTCLDDGDCFGGTCNETSNLCIECTQDSDCDNAEYCDGVETCDAGVCLSGSLPCDGDFCNETIDECQVCADDGDCFGGVCENSVCLECRQRSDCGNGLWCDGRETCNNDGECVPGNIRCAGEFCDEDANECLECEENVDCVIEGILDGMCNNTICVECLNDTHCDDGDFCNGEETCDILSGACVSGALPCADQFCNETSDGCQICNIDANCGVDGMCINNECVECTLNSDCSNGLWCDGWERCNEGVCEAGTPRCSGEFCNEDSNVCLDCDEDEDCFGGVCDLHTNECVECIVGPDCDSGFCLGYECVECRNSADCDNGLWCDGEETCNATSNLCEPVGGDIPCATEFCNETADTCLTCLDDVDCFGGVCDENNLCAECGDPEDCDPDQNWCDGIETCESGMCVPGEIPCGGPWCDEVLDECLQCVDDGDCCRFEDPDNCGKCREDVCVDCIEATDCDDGLFCNGAEVCRSYMCVAGELPCDGDFCDETDNSCLECTDDADCFGGSGRCIDNECFECDENSDCDNLLYCDGLETCVDGECELGDIPCPGDYCNEVDLCLACVEDADCFGGGRCINDVCMDCFDEADCDNGLYCDGLETCESGICRLGSIPCAGQFCDEIGNSCLTCLGDEDCFGGVCLDSMCIECTVDGDCSDSFCVENVCVECVEDAACDNGMFCDGVETCEANVCLAGTAPCAGETCDETDDMCLPCVEDSECGDFSSCVNTECVPYPIASLLTRVKLKGPGLAEVIFDPNYFDIALIKLTKTTEKSTLTITSDLKNFPVYLGGLTVDGSLKAIKGKDVFLAGPVTSTGGIGKIQIKGAEMGCSIDAPWIGTLSSAGDFSCDVMLTGTGSPKNWQTLNKLDIKSKLWDSELLITGDVGSAKIGFWGSAATLAVDVEAGLDGIFFTGDDVVTEGELNKFKFKDYESLNGGEAFGIIANEFGKMKTPPPFVDNDFNIQQVD